MNLSSRLGTGDRIASLLGGVGLVVFGAIGNHDTYWARIALVVLGVALTAGGIGGT